MTELARQLNRQVALLVDRAGHITHVVVGDAHRIFLPDFGRMRAGQLRFRGLRLWLTHLSGESLSRDNITDLVLLRLDLCLVVQVLETGLPGAVEYAHLIPPNPQRKVHHSEQRRSIFDLKDSFIDFIRHLEDEFSRTVDGTRRSDGREGAILVGVDIRGKTDATASLRELERLADTAGLKVLDRVLQSRYEIDPKYVVGKGKLEEIIVTSMQRGADVVVFDHDLKPSQLRSISEQTDLKVLDRTQLILDIFAQHAESRAGKLQVEVAQLRYVLPRLNIMTTAMSRLTGGIGGRGPGETKLEINKRRARERLTRLNRELKQLSQEREERRKNRHRSEVPIVALVGYTNAGKSTLLNTMTQSTVRAEDRLFATLDPVSRRMRFPEDREIILIDTVGFIRDLPNDLLEAFKATLEEISTAELLIQVVDMTENDPEPHLKAVDQILESLAVAQTQRLLVWNKCDAVPSDAHASLLRHYGGIAVSGATGLHLEALLLEIEKILWRPGRRVNVLGSHHSYDQTIEELLEESEDCDANLLPNSGQAHAKREFSVEDDAKDAWD